MQLLYKLIIVFVFYPKYHNDDWRWLFKFVFQFLEQNSSGDFKMQANIRSDDKCVRLGWDKWEH